MTFPKRLDVAFLLCYIFFCYLMLRITLQYIPLDTDVAFLRIKQDEMVWSFYRIAFFIHVYASIFVLLAGFTQFSNNILRKYNQLHKKSGWLYIIVVLLLAGPSGLVLAVYANGGWSAQIAFCLLAILWMFFTTKALYHIVKRQLIQHQKYMYRSFALALSAITLRAWKYILVWLFQPKPMDVYRWVAWLGWVVNLVFVEIIIYYYFRKPINPSA